MMEEKPMDWFARGFVARDYQKEIEEKTHRIHLLMEELGLSTFLIAFATQNPDTMRGMVTVTGSPNLRAQKLLVLDILHRLYEYDGTIPPKED